MTVTTYVKPDAKIQVNHDVVAGLYSVIVSPPDYSTRVLLTMTKEKLAQLHDIISKLRQEDQF